MANSPSLVNKHRLCGYIIAVVWVLAFFPFAFSQSVSWQLSGTQSFGLVFKNASGHFSNVVASTGANTNVNVSCAGDCAVISDSFVDGAALANGQVADVPFSCASATASDFSSTWTVSSAEFPAGASFSLSCSVLDLNAPILASDAGTWGGAQANAFHSEKFSAVTYGFSDGMDIVRRISEDGGAHWSAPEVLFSDERLWNARPSFFTGFDNNEWVFYERGGVVEYRSSADWENPRAIDSNRVNMRHPSASFAPSDEKIVVVFEAQGRQVWANASVHAQAGTLDWTGDVNLGAGEAPSVDINRDTADVWVVFVAPGGGIAYRMEDGATGNWSPTTAVPAATGSNPAVVLSPSGVFIAYERDNALFVVKSDDYGASWGAEEHVIDGGKRPNLSADPAGNVWLTYDQNGSVRFGFVD